MEKNNKNCFSNIWICSLLLLFSLCIVGVISSKLTMSITNEGGKQCPSGYSVCSNIGINNGNECCKKVGEATVKRTGTLKCFNYVNTDVACNCTEYGESWKAGGCNDNGMCICTDGTNSSGNGKKCSISTNSYECKNYKVGVDTCSQMSSNFPYKSSGACTTEYSCESGERIGSNCYEYTSFVGPTNECVTDGKYLSGDECVDCDVGYSCVGGKKTHCELGYYQNAKGQSSCKPCPENSICSSTKFECESDYHSVGESCVLNTAGTPGYYKCGNLCLWKTAGDDLSGCSTIVWSCSPNTNAGNGDDSEGDTDNAGDSGDNSDEPPVDDDQDVDNNTDDDKESESSSSSSSSLSSSSSSSSSDEEYKQDGDGESSSSNNTSSNPSTGNIVTFVVLVLGITMLGYVVYYYSVLKDY